jgi:hypothetical protein
LQKYAFVNPGTNLWDCLKKEGAGLQVEDEATQI